MLSFGDAAACCTRLLTNNRRTDYYGITMDTAPSLFCLHCHTLSPVHSPRYFNINSRQRVIADLHPTSCAVGVIMHSPDKSSIGFELAPWTAQICIILSGSHSYENSNITGRAHFEGHVQFRFVICWLIGVQSSFFGLYCHRLVGLYRSSVCFLILERFVMIGHHLL